MSHCAIGNQIFYFLLWKERERENSILLLGLPLLLEDPLWQWNQLLSLERDFVEAAEHVDNDDDSKAIPQ